ncbi:hypothetical protein GALMADRAFT_698030 [Galerina marginata CBS 339.88]|uniref:Uncharacterized protein n=1 Tax=Galerina marginata (strain CBS 339.88) TaxID=685588 RepID=A0A067TP48_GALM3|nr:hypothetical protein GALMADRAFT_698030 [Galerina marginata CBS 339.88]
MTHRRLKHCRLSLKCNWGFAAMTRYEALTDLQTPPPLAKWIYCRGFPALRGAVLFCAPSARKVVYYDSREEATDKILQSKESLRDKGLLLCLSYIFTCLADGPSQPVHDIGFPYLDTRPDLWLSAEPCRRTYRLFCITGQVAAPPQLLA